MISITALMDNQHSENKALVSEHGLSFLVEGEGFRYLFDCGPGKSTWDNARRLGRSLRDLDGVILSHSHYDHAGGFRDLPKQGGPSLLYTGPNFFEPKLSFDGRKYEDLSAGFDCSFLKAQGIVHREVRDLLQLAPGVFLVGNFPRTHEFETIPGRYVRRTEAGICPDDFSDEICLAMDTPRGLAILVGCSHPGILNMVEQVCKVLDRPVWGVFGGIHLSRADSKRIETTVAALKEKGLEILGLSHCSGQAAEKAAEAHGLTGCHLAPGDRMIIE